MNDYLEILQLADKNSNYHFELLKDITVTNNKLLEAFGKVYSEEYREPKDDINLLEIVDPKELTNSRILARILDYPDKDKKKWILESFFEHLKNKNENFDLKVNEKNESVVHCEKDKIDILVKNGDSALIIENKFNNAKDQPSQLARYLKAVEKDYKCEDIYLVYLTSLRDKVPKNQTWRINKVNYREKYKSRYLHLTFKDDILIWLEKVALICKEKEEESLTVLINTYIDYLKLKFKLRKMDTLMNEKLQNLIRQEMELGSNPMENLIKINKKNEELDNLKNQLDELINAETKSFFGNLFDEMKKDFKLPGHFLDSDDEEYTTMGITFSIEKGSFSVILQHRKEDDAWHYGIGVHNTKKNKKDKKLKNFIEILINTLEIEKDDELWYAYKKTTLKECYEDFSLLIKKTALQTLPNEEFFSSSFEILSKEFETLNPFLKQDGDSTLLGVMFEHNGLSFSILIEGSEDTLHFGVSNDNGDNDKKSEEKIKQLLAPVFRSSGLQQDSECWYGYKETAKCSAYDHLSTLIESVKGHLN